MKKINILFPILATPMIGITPILTSCADYSNTIRLKNFTDASLVVGVDHSDYWLCAEPAASVKETVLGLHRVGSLQELYGGDGFNQAVLVCKKSLLTSNPKYLNEIKGYLKGNADYIANPDNLESIIKNIQDNQLDKSRASVLNLQNTSTPSLINCNAKFEENQLTDILSYCYFINKANRIDSSVQEAVDINFYKGFPQDTTTRESSDPYTIYAPDGAPAVGLANVLANKGSLCNTTNIYYLNPTTILSMITLKKPDLAVLPSNLATKLYNEYSQEYVFLSTVTWGNLYFLSKNYNTPLTLDNIKEQLYGKEVGVQQLVSTPGYALKIILKEHDINYEE